MLQKHRALYFIHLDFFNIVLWYGTKNPARRTLAPEHGCGSSHAPYAHIPQRVFAL